MITDKDLERQNFLSWYSIYATEDDIEKAKVINRPAIDRLIGEYSYEIERINMSKNLHRELF